MQTQTQLQHLSLPFTCRSQPGTISVTIQPNRDPEHAWGLDLIFPSIPRSLFARNFHGFPVLSATVAYPTQNAISQAPTPSSPSSSSPYSTLGYGCLFGWIQLVKEISFSSSSSSSSNGIKDGKWEMDIYPWSQDLKSPFVTWGYNPTLFDAPAQLFDDKVKRGEGWKDWTAQSFLCVLVDAGMSKRMVPIRGGGFEWGFDVERLGEGRDASVQRKIGVREVKELDVEGEWDGRVVKLLRGWYPGWEFLDAEGSL